MQKQIFSLFLLISLTTMLNGQVNKGCIFIDFEDLPNGNVNSGVPISNQYQEGFGLSFKLENGDSPVIAKIGGQTEAFSSQWGGDNPAPNIDIGTFFLTDDGSTAGNVTSPLILEFEIPIDSFSGCILDLDYSESFVIEAFDEDNNLILSEKIEDGDPGTGDGQLTCWGFNLPGCEGSIHKIIYTGTRTDFGSFGLGLDNFSFCYSGLNIDFETKDFSCTEPGEIMITNLTPETYEYSVNGNDFTTDNTISNLQPGAYDLTVRDADGCDATFEFEINELSALNAQVIIDQTTCNEENGQLIINALPSNNPQFSINGSAFESNNSFANLAQGNYELSIQDENGCQFDTLVVINTSEAPPTILGYESTPDFCSMDNGTVSIEAEGGTGNLSYGFELIGFQQENSLEGLAQGDYQVVVTDELNCSNKIEVNVPPGEILVAEILDIIPASCNDEGGQLTVEVLSNSGLTQYSLDGINFQNSPVFDNLSVGNYSVIVIDEQGCEIQLDAEIIPGINVLEADILEVKAPSCSGEGGQLIVELLSNSSPVQYSLDGVVFQDEPIFNNLETGVYTITIIDEQGCEEQVNAEIPCIECDIYVPNVFAVSGSGVNNKFQIFTSENYNTMIQLYSIYDRWGNLVYTRENFSIHEGSEMWWRGYSNNKLIGTGVYTYLIILQDECRRERVLSGDVGFMG